MDRHEMLLGAEMIGALVRTLDNLLGRGEAAVTVPPLDGAMKPNRMLDEAEIRLPLDTVDCLADVGGVIHASAGDRVYVLSPSNGWELRRAFSAPVTAIAPAGSDGLAIALGNGEIVILGGVYDGRHYRVSEAVRCITAMSVAGNQLYLANGTATNAAHDWQRDLMERNASGSIWRIDLERGEANRLADGLAWPAGLVVTGQRMVVAESWRHRLITLPVANTSQVAVLAADLPFYPGRISPAQQGWWLAGFAPRSQLVEFVLREPPYRQRMLAEVPQQFWVAPTLRSGRSFYEPLQGGSVKHLGMLKPWAPTMSAGVCVKLDETFRPQWSLQSRADGATHGVTSTVERDGMVHVAARGDGLVVALSGSGEDR